MNYPHFSIITIILSLALLLMSHATAALAAGNISATDKYAWSETSGWLNFAPSGGGVTVYPDHLEGYVWQENIGWIKVGSHTGGGVFTYGNATNTNWGVNRAGTVLSGFAWSETAGWINFKPTGGGVVLNEQSGAMDGWAWGENIGWLHIRNASPAYGVQFYPTFGVSVIVFDGVIGYAAQDGAGFWKSTDGGATWTSSTTQPDNQRVKGLVIHPTVRNILYAATYGDGVYTSTDSGDTWSACTGQPGNLNAVTLAMDPDGTLYAGTEGGIFTSADCSSWTPLNSGLTVGAATPPVSIVIDPATPSHLFAGIDNAGIFISANSGGSWNPATRQPLNPHIRALAIKPGDSTRLFAATYGGGLFLSTDSGVTWDPCGTQPANLNIVSLVIDAAGKLYAGTEAGVFVSTDGCANWTAMNGGLP